MQAAHVELDMFPQAAWLVEERGVRQDYAKLEIELDRWIHGEGEFEGECDVWEISCPGRR